jgi:colanic acid/amylovoran biosynthesis glycosyltransferase
VVFCTHDKPGSLGGPFTWLAKLLPALRTQGVDGRVLALTHYGGTGPVIESLRKDGFDVSVQDCHERTADNVRWILEQLADRPPTVFVPNFVVPALFAARWLKAAGAATVAVLHSDDDYYRAIQDEFVFGRSEYRVTDVVTVSEKLQTELTERGLPQGQLATLIPYGVDLPDLTQRSTSDTLRIAYVGRLAETQKRIRLVTESLIHTCKTVPNTEAVIFGDGPERAEVETMLAANAAGLPVRLGGALPYHQVQPTLLNFDAIVLMSDYEGLPISLLEGMACGCVAIAREMHSGIPQLVRNGVTGLLINDRPESMAIAAAALESDRNLAASLSTAGRQLVARSYSHQTSVHRWAEHLKQLSKNRTPRPYKVPKTITLPRPNPSLESPTARLNPKGKLNKELQRLRKKLGALRRRLALFGQHDKKPL